MAIAPNILTRDGNPRLVLGTAQLGAPYGSVRKTVPPAPAEALALVREAVEQGVTQIDTARAYDGSEARLGVVLAGGVGAVTVITKLSPLRDIEPQAAPATVRAAVDASVQASRQALALASLPLLLLHRAAHLTGWNGAAWQRLLDLRRDGVIGALGVSVQSPDEAKAALGNRDVSHIQLACNILDDRWDAAGIPALVAARPDVTIHARSALLQGVLLATQADGWPKIAGLDWQRVAAWLRAQTAQHGRRGVADLCYSYLRALPWIDGIVVGMASREHLADNIALFARPALGEAEAACIAADRPAVPADLLNPARWP